MRVSFVSTILGYPWGGADTLWTRAAEAASERGDELLLCVSPAVAASPRIAALRARGAIIHERTPPVPPTRLIARLTGKLRRLRGQHDEVVNALAQFSPDLVIISLGGTYDLVLEPTWLDWFARTGTPYQVIANYQVEKPVLAEAKLDLARRALGSAQHVNFVSTRNLVVTRRHLNEPLTNARVIQNPLRWHPTDAAPWPDSPHAQLATVSRLHEGKGIQLLLKALAAQPASSDWHLNIYGHGPAEQFLRTTAADMGISERVAFRGYVQELRAVWAENQMLVSPSLEDGVPMTIPEAMLCARPVLSNAVGGAEDWLTDGVTGFICPAPTLPLLTATVAQALSGRRQWPAMGSAAAAAAQAYYRPEDFRLLLP